MARQGRNWEDVIAKLEVVAPLFLATNIPDDMLDALQGGQSYPDLFAAAFGDSEITPVKIAFAIATYERTLVPNNSPWDRYIDGDRNAMTQDQLAGWELYLDTPCANCHEPPLFSDDNFRNIGLRPSSEDLGEFDVTGENNDRGDFKTPSLRNAGLRRALMHVGWVTDVADAIDFYNAGTNNTGHVQFIQDQSGIPGTNVDIDEIDVFGDDPVARGQVIDFIVNGLTDERAANELFPFDRPTLWSEREEFTELANFEVEGTASDGSTTAAVFTALIEGNSGLGAQYQFLASDSVSVNVQVTVDPADIGRVANFYCAAVANNEVFLIDSNGTRHNWSDPDQQLTAAHSAVLGSIEMISVLNDLNGFSGKVDIYVGYDLQDGVIRYNSIPISISVL